MYELIIRGGQLVTSQEDKRCDIAISNGIIAAIAECGSLGSAGSEVDARGLYILPGLIDAHVHFREPGLTHKEDFLTGSSAALHGGMTYVVDMPNVIPVTTTVERLLERKALAKEKSCLDMGFFALLTSDNLSEMEGLKEAGAVGFKIYLGTSVGNIAAPDDGVMLEQFRVAERLGMRIGFHAENNAINDYYTKMVMRSQPGIARALIEARPAFSEVEAVSKAIAFARECGTRIHIYHVSSGKTVDVIHKAQKDGVNVTAETCPHYLLRDEDDYAKLGNALKVFPTVKTKWDRDKLWEGIKDGTIGMVVTDHAPHTPNEKNGNIWEAMAGASGVEISARLMLTEVNKGNLTLRKMCELMSENPAKIWNISGRGCVEIGKPANLTIVDLSKEGIICNEQLHGKNNNTAFNGVRTIGMPVMSVLNGKLYKL